MEGDIVFVVLVTDSDGFKEVEKVFHVKHIAKAWVAETYKDELKDKKWYACYNYHLTRKESITFIGDRGHIEIIQKEIT